MRREFPIGFDDNNECFASHLYAAVHIANPFVRSEGLLRLGAAIFAHC